MKHDESTWRQVLAALPVLETRADPALAIALVDGDDYAARQGTAWLRWPGDDGRPAQCCPWDGLFPANWGLLLVMSDAALGRVRVEGEACMAGLVRRGEIMPFVLRQRDELEAAGILEFIETLELATPKH